MSLKMTPSDIALAVLVVAALKTHVHQVTVAGVQGVFGQHYYNYGQSSPHMCTVTSLFLKRTGLIDILGRPQSFPVVRGQNLVTNEKTNSRHDNTPKGHG